LPRILKGRDFGGDCALERFVAVWGVHGKIGVALVHFSIYYCYPFSIFFKKQFFVLLVVVVVCALNLIQRAGTGDENFSFKLFEQGGSQRAQLK
jgi:hypothetical protein